MDCCPLILNFAGWPDFPRNPRAEPALYFTRSSYC